MKIVSVTPSRSFYVNTDIPWNHADVAKLRALGDTRVLEISPSNNAPKIISMGLLIGVGGAVEPEKHAIEIVHELVADHLPHIEFPELYFVSPPKKNVGIWAIYSKPKRARTFKLWGQRGSRGLAVAHAIQAKKRENYGGLDGGVGGYPNKEIQFAVQGCIGFDPLPATQFADFLAKILQRQSRAYGKWKKET